MKSLMKTAAALVILLILYIAFWPVAVDPVAWNPKPAPALEGRYARNDYLAQAEILGTGDGIGPEDIDVDSDGRIYAPYEDGRVLRYDSNGKNGELFVNTGGRPLGMEFDADAISSSATPREGFCPLHPMES